MAKYYNNQGSIDDCHRVEQQPLGLSVTAFCEDKVVLCKNRRKLSSSMRNYTTLIAL